MLWSMETSDFPQTPHTDKQTRFVGYCFLQTNPGNKLVPQQCVIKGSVF